MKKKEKRLILTISLVIAGVIILAILGISFLSTVPNFAKIDCIYGDISSCSSDSSANLASADGVFTIPIDDPSSGEDRRNALLDRARNFNSDLDNFLDTHTKDSTTKVKTEFSPNDFQDWEGILPVSAEGSTGLVLLVDNVIRETLGEQLIIIEGERTDTNEAFKIAGLCIALDRTCSVNDPFPEDDAILSFTDIKMYFKEGGYKLSDSCSEFNVGCNGNGGGENEECRVIGELCGEGYEGDCCEGLVCDTGGDIWGGCVPSKNKTFYRLENNACKEININELEKQENDFLTLEECEENIGNIKIFPVIISLLSIIIIGGIIWLFIRFK